MYVCKIALSDIVNRVPSGGLAKYLFIDIVTVYWYIFALAFYYLTLGLVLCKLNILWKRGLLCVLAVASMTVFYIYYIVLNKGEDQLYRIIYYAYFFALGFQIYNNKNFLKKFAENHVLPIAAVGLLALHALNKEWVMNPILRVAAVTTINLGIISFVIGVKRFSNSAVLRYCGRYSLYIYIMHNFFTVAFRAAYMRSGFSLPAVIYLALCLVMTLLCCALVQFSVSRIWPLDVFFNPVKAIKRFKDNRKVTSNGQ